ncbi:MAG: porin, partial [Paucibacter sp.]|nr:porin [Roseateles sp.]
MRLLPCTASAVLLAALSAAHADSSIQLYGIADLGLVTTDHGNPADPNGAANVTPLPTSAVTYNPATAPNGKTEARVSSLINGGLSPSRWGIKGSEDLGDGLAAVFTLESPINVAAGTVPNVRLSVANSQANTPYATQEGSFDGQLFARESTVGLRSKALGELRFGRQQTVMADALGQFDINSGYMDPLVYNGGYNGGGFTAEARWDNAIKYGVDLNENFRVQ